MKTLIVYASPNKNGHCAQILQEVTARLSSENQSFEVLDLYSIKYSPVLPAAELYTIGNKKINGQNLKFQEMISNSDRLIFIYPLWWGSMPAILKGFFDRVFTPHFAYQFSHKGIPEGLLKGKKAAVFVSSASSNTIKLIFSQNRSSALIRDDVLKFCGISAKVYPIDKAVLLDDSQKQKITLAVKNGLDWLK